MRLLIVLSHAVWARAFINDKNSPPSMLVLVCILIWMIRKCAIKTQTQHGKQTHNAKSAGKKEGRKYFYSFSSRLAAFPTLELRQIAPEHIHKMAWNPLWRDIASRRKLFPFRTFSLPPPALPHTQIFTQRRKKRNSTNLFLSIKSFSKLNFVFPFRFLPRFTPTNLNSKMIIFSLRLPFSCRWQWGDLLECREEEENSKKENFSSSHSFFLVFSEGNKTNLLFAISFSELAHSPPSAIEIHLYGWVYGGRKGWVRGKWSKAKAPFSEHSTLCV